ncbi:EFR1 family ferrodoxin [Adlercreutzia sp. ZJ473]|uniref:EFR1 family ferrodoxin n=1 Tax=Adlercreutzia sp. ZJ473 TaxID=2722822 RepID=UPI001551D943|nr:EFR1 family ferrodoxin [Adlercreutzia sp. ZJ473]
MILYFSATGNSLAAARRIARENGDRLYDLGAGLKAGQRKVAVRQGEDLGFVFPVYRWSTPAAVDRFVRGVTFLTPDGAPFKPGYCYCVITYGYFPGDEVRYFARELRASCGIELDAAFAVPSVENCIYVSNPPDKARAAAKLAKAEPRMEEVARAVAARRRGARAQRNPVGVLLSKVTGTQDKPRSTKPFNVLADRCVGCGTCVEACPTNSIRLEGGRPAWSGDACSECLACIHRCPREATQYGKISLKRNRYLHPELAREVGEPTGSQV